MPQRVALADIITELRNLRGLVESGEISLSGFSEQVDILTVRLEKWAFRNLNGKKVST